MIIIIVIEIFATLQEMTQYVIDTSNRDLLYYNL